jgi:hypothetical protein
MVCSNRKAAQAARIVEEVCQECYLNAIECIRKEERENALIDFKTNPRIHDKYADELWDLLRLENEIEEPFDIEADGVLSCTDFCWQDHLNEQAERIAVRLFYLSECLQNCGDDSIGSVVSQIQPGWVPSSVEVNRVQKYFESEPARLELPNLKADNREEPARLELPKLTSDKREEFKGFPCHPLKEILRRSPKRREPLIENLLRRGETLNIVASPKTGKSWLVANLVFAIANGGEWLGLKCSCGRVLVVDGELHPEEIAYRYGAVAKALGCGVDRIDFLPLRGERADVNSLAVLVESRMQAGEYQAVILDALYQFLPERVSENDNNQMLQVYKKLDRIAKVSGASVIVIHHTSKGSQDGKAITDIGAGAGSVSRAADSHLIIRQHELAGCCVVDCETRSFSRPDPLTIRFDFPVWSATHIAPQVKVAKPDFRTKQDAETKAGLLKALSEGGWFTTYDLRSRTGYGESRIVRGLNVLLSDQIETKQFRNKRTKQITMKYKAKS